MKDFKSFGLADYLNIVWRRRWYVIVVFVLVASGISTMVWRLPNLYRSETRVLVERPFVSEDYVRPIIQQTPTDRINSIREQIASRSFLERIVEQFQYGGYKSNPKFTMEDAVRSIRNQIGIEKTSDDTFTLSFTSTDPHLAREVTQRLADELIRANTASRVDKTIATDQFLDEQLREAVQALAKQEEKIKEYKQAHLGELPEQSDANMNSLSGLYSQLTATESALGQARDQKKFLDYRKENLVEALAAFQNPGAPAAVPAKRAPDRTVAALESELKSRKAMLADMALKYTASHPDVKNLERLIQDLEQQIRDGKAGGSEPDDSSQASTPAPDSTRDERYAKAQQEVKMLDFDLASMRNQIDKREKDRAEILQQIKLLQARLNKAPAVEQEMASMLREQDVLKQQYVNLENKKFSSRMAANVETNKNNETYKIIDEPNLPIKPIAPKRLQFILIGIAVGLFLGFGSAFGRELMDSTIGSEDEAQSVLNLPVLATIFEIPNKEKPIRRLLKQKERAAES